MKTKAKNDGMRGTNLERKRAPRDRKRCCKRKRENIFSQIENFEKNK